MNLCWHLAQYGENVVLPIEVSLEHFDKCLAPERRLVAWGFLREQSELGRRCQMADHDMVLDELRWSHDRIVELTRELAGRPRRKAARAAYRRRQRSHHRRNR